MVSENYLVTGGAGFIGSHIVEALLGQGATVRVLDNFSTGKRQNLAPFVDHIELIEGDLRDPEALRTAVKGATYVLHQAALASVPGSIAEPLITHACNVTGTLNLLLACRDAGVHRVVYASSSSVYGNGAELPKRETMLQKAESPYAVSKLAGEQYCQAFHEVYGLETVCLRYFNVFGPRQDPGSPYAAVIPKFITRMLSGEPPTIHGDGLQSRDFAYVADVAEANLLAATMPDVAGQVFNIACGRRYTLNDLVTALDDILDTGIRPSYTDPRPGDIRHSQADIGAAQRYLKYEPEVDFREGLERTVAWYRQQVTV